MFPVLPFDQQEALCRRCGMSCHTPIRLGSKSVIIPELHCRFLAYDADAKALCTVYDNRFERAPWCRAAEHAIESDGLAHDCPYTANIPGYQGKHWAGPLERKVILPLVRDKLITEGLPFQDSPDSAIKLLESDGSRWACELSADGARYVFYKID